MKYLFALIHMGVIAAMAYVGADIFYAAVLPDIQKPLEQGTASVPADKDAGPRVQAVLDSEQYGAIVKRNLFKVETEKKRNPW